jgi:hypothetical protein
VGAKHTQYARSTVASFAFKVKSSQEIMLEKKKKAAKQAAGGGGG